MINNATFPIHLYYLFISNNLSNLIFSQQELNSLKSKLYLNQKFIKMIQIQQLQMEIKNFKSKDKHFLSKQNFVVIRSEETSRKDQEVIKSQDNENLRKMQNLNENACLRKFIHRLASTIVLSSPSIKINEAWEEIQQTAEQQVEENEEETVEDKIKNKYFPFKLFSLLEGFLLTFQIWTSSMEIIFRKSAFNEFYAVVIILQILKILLKIYQVNTDLEIKKSVKRSKFEDIFRPSVIIITSSLMIVRSLISIIALEILIGVIVMIALTILVKNISNYFEEIQIFAEKNKLHNQFRILKLFIYLLVIVHTFGLLLYLSTYFTPANQQSWTQVKGITQKDWFIQYIYSIYWALTTLVTVGYGDLTPQNYVEILFVMVIQVVGTSFFGYLINVIGISVVNISKKKEEFQHYQTTANKMKDLYNLSTELSKKMKHDIKSKQQMEKVIPLLKKQQNQLLEFVDEKVKKNFIFETNIRVIKKSILFLTYFTVKFQNQIALKLIRVIYGNKQQVETEDKDTKQPNLIIINSGKINVFASKKQNNIEHKKLVKSIQPIEDKPALNVFGYTGLILNKKIKLSATTDENAAGYQLKRRDVLECIEKSLKDNQSFHQLREKYLQVRFTEEIEAPSLRQRQYHYNPNIFILSKKNAKNFNQKRSKRSRNSKTKIFANKPIKVILQSNKIIVENLENIQQKKNYRKESICKNNIFFSIEDIQLVEKKSESQKSHLQIQVKEQINDEKQQNMKKQLNIDQVKDFEYYMKNHNIGVVSKNYQKSCLNKSYKKRILTNLIKES